MKPIFLAPLLAFTAFAQSRSFYTDRPDIFGRDLSLGAGGTDASPTRTANTAKAFTFNAPLYTAASGRGTFPTLYWTDDGTDRSLHLGRSTGGLTDFRVYVSTYGSPTSGNTAMSIVGSGVARFEYSVVFVATPRPSADNTVDLGSSSFSWKDGWFDGDLYVGGSGKIQFQNETRIESPSDGTLAFRNAAAGNMTRVLFGTANSSGQAFSFSTSLISATDGLGTQIPFAALSYTLQDRTITHSTASPESVVTAPTGSIHLASITGAGSLWVKNSGSGNTGWVQVPTGSSGIGGSTGSTDNRLLRADGTGGSTLQNSAILIDDYTSSTANNVAIKIDDGSTATISAVVTPKGNGAFILGPKPDGTATGGNARGPQSVDLQINRFSASDVASGNYATVLGGYRNSATSDHTTAGGIQSVASGQYGAVAIGYSATASGQYASAAFGYLTTASGRSSIAAGEGALSDKHGQWSVSGGYFAAGGDSQTSVLTLRNNTSSTTPTVLFLNGSSSRLTIPNNTFATFTILVSASTATATSQRYSYKLEGCIGKGTTAGSTSMPVAVTKTVIYEHDSAADVDATADTTNGALSITVTAANSTATRWSASVMWNQVGFP